MYVHYEWIYGLYVYMVVTVKDYYWLKELSVEQRMQVVVNRQLVAVPQDGCHTVEVGWRRHEEAVLPGRSRGRASTRPSISHGATHLVSCHLRRVMNPLQKSLDPRGLKSRTKSNLYSYAFERKRSQGECKDTFYDQHLSLWEITLKGYSFSLAAIFSFSFNDG